MVALPLSLFFLFYFVFPVFLTIFVYFRPFFLQEKKKTTKLVFTEGRKVHQFIVTNTRPPSSRTFLSCWRTFVPIFIEEGFPVVYRLQARDSTFYLYTSRGIRRKKSKRAVLLGKNKAKRNTLHYIFLQMSTTPSSSPAPPGGQRTLQKRRQARSVKDKQANQTPTSTRQAGFGGSTNSILKIYTDEANGLRIDPLVVLFLAVGFIFSVVALHIITKVTGKIF